MNDLDLIKFPVLVVADDGWLQLCSTASDLSKWNYIGINKYNKRRVLLYDSSDNLWLLKTIIPEKRLTFIRLLLAYTFYNPRLQASLVLQPIYEEKTAAISAAIKHALDKDDDVSTQWSTASEIKKSIENKNTFRDIVSALKRKRAI